MVPGLSFRPPTIGLDIGSAVVKAVALRRGRRGWSLLAAGCVPLGDERLDEGGAAGETSVSESVSGLIASLGLPRATVAASLPGHAAIVKRLTLPDAGRADLTELVRLEAERHIPFDLSEVQLDFQVVGGDAGATGRLDVLLVAARRDRIDDRVAIVEQAGRRPVVVDLEAFALANAYRLNYPERIEAFSALVHVGSNVTVVCLLERGSPVFARDLVAGGSAHAVESLVAEVRNTIDFYQSTAPVQQLSRIVVSGGAHGAVGLVDRLAAVFDVPIDVLDPFRRVSARPHLVGEAERPSYAVAVGLAMRREGDR